MTFHRSPNLTAFRKEVTLETKPSNVWPQYLYVRDYVSEQVLM